MEEQPSRVHLDPLALNTVLEKFVNKPGVLEAAFVDGHLQVKMMGMLIILQGLEIDADGADALLRIVGEAKP